MAWHIIFFIEKMKNKRDHFQHISFFQHIYNIIICFVLTPVYLQSSVADETDPFCV